MKLHGLTPEVARSQEKYQGEVEIIGEAGVLAGKEQREQSAGRELTGNSVPTWRRRFTFAAD